jgi:hypothetical protein
MQKKQRLTPQVGIVVPTLGTRQELLRGCLESIRVAGHAYVILVGPEGIEFKHLLASGLIDEYLIEPKANLAAAIDSGLRRMPPNVKYVNWLGDDDELMPGAISLAGKRMSDEDNPVLVFGGCQYTDFDGRSIFLNNSGLWASWILKFGPQLVPQPGALFRLEAYKEVGGLNESLHWAFDYDLMIQLKRLGRFAYLSSVLAKFRWHSDSLSVKERHKSVSEASRVRVERLPKWLSLVSELWEWPLRKATLYAGLLLSKKVLLH